MHFELGFPSSQKICEFNVTFNSGKISQTVGTMGLKGIWVVWIGEGDSWFELLLW